MNKLGTPIPETVASAGVRSKTVVLLLFAAAPSVSVCCVWSLFCYAVLCVLSCFAIIPLRKRELVALLLLSSDCHVAVSVLCLCLMVPWIGLQCVIVVVPGHTRLLFNNKWQMLLVVEMLYYGYKDRHTMVPKNI